MGKIDRGKGFAPVSAKQWKQQLQYDLKGADYNKTLLWESADGIHVKPFYTSEDLDSLPIFHHGRQGGWKAGQGIEANTATEANRKARHALDMGAEALQFNLSSVGMDPKELLQGIDLQGAQVHFTFHFLNAGYLQTLLQQFPKSAAGAFLHIDPVGNLVRTGNWFNHRKADLEVIQSLYQTYRDRTNINLPGVQADIYLNAGATMVQQLAYALAHAHEYLHIMGEGLKTPPVFTMAVGSDYFFEIAKLRALRLLWEILAAEYGAHPSCHIVAIPAKRNKTLYDYNMNMLRSTSECMSAILGGADTVINLRYDHLFKNANEFGERMARNQLLLLKHESYFDAVENPADGSYYIENITRQLAEKALALFKQLEAGGGLLKQLGEHHIQKKVRESAGKEQQRFDQGQHILVGTNAHQLKNERMKGQLEKPLSPNTKAIKTGIEPLPVRRLAAIMEQNRLADE